MPAPYRRTDADPHPRYRTSYDWDGHRAVLDGSAFLLGHSGGALSGQPKHHLNHHKPRQCGNRQQGGNTRQIHQGSSRWPFLKEIRRGGCRDSCRNTLQRISQRPSDGGPTSLAAACGEGKGSFPVLNGLVGCRMDGAPSLITMQALGFMAAAGPPAGPAAPQEAHCVLLLREM
jgi:hypothetical protein